MTHTCHFPHCPPNWCPLCGSCEACAEAYRARRPTLPVRLIDDASTPAVLREAVELLRETPVGEDPALDAHWAEKGAAIEARVRAVVAAKGGCS